MEDILASIKRIIAEDSDAPAARPSARARKGPVAVPDVAPLAEPVPAPETTDAPEDAAVDHIALDVAEPSDILELTSPLVEPYEELPMAAAEPSRRDDGPIKAAATILSTSAEAASRNAFAALSQLQIREESGESNTLEGLVGDLLRPMLRDWLDGNLPAIVERIVEAEVKRVSGRG